MRKSKLLITFVVVLLLAVIVASVLLVFNNQKIMIQNANLNKNINSYNVVIKYLRDVINDNHKDSYICIGIDGYTKDDVILSLASKDGEILETGEEVDSALAIIKAAFSDMGYTLDAIRIKDGCISFDTIDGQYSLIFALDKTANIGSIRWGDSDTNIKKAQDNWYHKNSN